MWGTIYRKSGLTSESLAPAVLALAAMVITITDFRFQLIPDRVTVPLTVAGLLLAVVRGDLSVTQSLIGGATGLMGFYLLAAGGNMALKKQALGSGDIKLLGALGLYVGWVGVLATAFLGANLALLFLVARRIFCHTHWKAPVPFGPFLIYASILWTMYGGEAWLAYSELL